MYICTECGAQYKEKPEYCDCGNDTFEEGAGVNGVNSDAASDSSIEGGVLSYPKAPVNKSDILSWLIFSVLMVLSALVLLFFPKINPQPDVDKKPAVVKTTHPDIPSIDSFWVDPKPQVVQESEPEPFIVNEVKKITEIIVKPKPVPKKVEVKTVKKTQPVTKSQTSTAQPVKTKSQTVTKPAQQKVTQSAPAPKRSLDYEMLNYRSALRMRLLSNLTISEVEGVGKCGIEFAIDGTGKLINRGFTFQSDNKTVNDAIYKMLMRTPHFNPPPASYDGRKIKMTFTLGNGSYEVSFVE